MSKLDEILRARGYPPANSANPANPGDGGAGKLAGLAELAAPPAPAVADLERRRAEVVARLKADSALWYAFDVQGAAPGQAVPDARDVSLMLGLRDSAGTIVTGELRVPSDRWPGLSVFAAFWRQAAERRPS